MAPEKTSGQQKQKLTQVLSAMYEVRKLAALAKRNGLFRTASAFDVTLSLLWAMRNPDPRDPNANVYHRLPVVIRADSFISHSWSCPGWLRILAICHHLNLNMAIGSCLLTSFFSVLFLVFSAGSFDSIAKQPHAVLQLWLLGFPTVVFLTVYLFGHVWSQKSFWFDRICVDQLNLDVKHQTLQAIPAFVAGSREMLVLWDETYSSRLWCNYELAVHAKTAASPDAIKALPVWIPVWTLLLFGFPAILNCLVYEESVSLHPETPLSLFLGWFQTYTLPESIYSMLIGFPVSWFCLQKLRRHKLMLDQMSDFDLRNAKCTEESDRQVIEENVLNLFDEALEPPLSVSLDALDMLPKMSTLEDGNADSGGTGKIGSIHQNFKYFKAP